MDKSIVPRRETVEVDKDLFEYVQQHAIPLKDDFSSALRKLLFPKETSEKDREDYLPNPKSEPTNRENSKPLPKPSQRRRLNLTPQTAYELPILECLYEYGGSAQAGEVIDRIYRKMKKFFTEDDLSKLDSRDETRWSNKVRWASSVLKNDGQVTKTRSGIWSLTDKGRRRLLASGPTNRK